jgi:tetratricopeptide (TPR) repeat protein
MPCTYWWGIRILRFGAVFLFLLSSAGAGFGQATPSCSVETFDADPKLSLEACTRVLSGGSLQSLDRAQVLKIRARSFNRLGSLDAAVEDFEQALQLAPQDVELQLRRGWAAIDQKKPELAFEQARRALELNPGDAGAYHLIGVVHFSFYKRFDAALAALNESIRLKPQDPWVHYNRQRVFLQQGRHAEALKEAEFILSLPAAMITKPDVIFSQKRTTYRIAASQERATLLATLGRMTEAQQAWDWAVQTDPDAQTFAGRAAFYLSLAHGDLGSDAFGRVQRDVSQSIALDPDFWWSRELQARLHFDNRRYDEAERELAIGIKFYPINGTMRWRRAMVLKRLDRIDEATVEAITAFDVDRGFMSIKLEMLHARGYLPQQVRPDADLAAVITDAVRACMLDEECG